MQFFRRVWIKGSEKTGRGRKTLRHGLALDWADEDHQVCEYDVQTGSKQHYTIAHGAESLQEWFNQLRIRHGGQRVAVVLEQARGGLIHVLMTIDFNAIYPVNPQSLSK